MPNRHFLRSDIFTVAMVYSFYFRLFPNELNSNQNNIYVIMYSSRAVTHHLKDVGVFSTEIKTASSAYSTQLPHNGDETLNIIEASAEYDVCF